MPERPEVCFTQMCLTPFLAALSETFCIPYEELQASRMLATDGVSESGSPTKQSGDPAPGRSSTMAELLNELASRTGLPEDQAHQGVGALLALLKERLSPEQLAHLKSAIPDSEEALAAYKDKAEAAGGGLMDAVKGMAGKILRRGDTAALQQHFAGAGLSVDQLKSFLPKLHDMLAAKLPPDVLAQIEKHVPGFGPAAK